MWQPLQESTSPGRTCSQLRCTGRVALALAVEHRDLECDVRRHLHPHRAVGLDHRVAEDLAHEVAGAERRTVDVQGIPVRQRHRLLEAHEAGEALRRRPLTRVRDGGDVRRGGVDAVEVVDAPDVEHAHALGDEVRVDVHPRSAIEDHHRRAARLRHDDVGDHPVGFRGRERQEGALRGVVHPDAVERRRTRNGRITQHLVGAGAYLAAQQGAARASS